jgi:hypothetical protein
MTGRSSYSGRHIPKTAPIKKYAWVIKKATDDAWPARNRTKPSDYGRLHTCLQTSAQAPSAKINILKIQTVRLKYKRVLNQLITRDNLEIIQFL